ncbi:hypothetical protein [Saccharopolyspora cebuensis]|uniref:Uncharacterized protein n=1 Tax=Saccharopolyspora cebuensis TaxID=418759 RepID=A0ABV4CGV0_9PSEU
MVSYSGSLRARRLTADEVSGNRLRFTGRPAHRVRSGGDRANLPSPLEPGTPYRDVRVRRWFSTGLRPDDYS